MGINSENKRKRYEAESKCIKDGKCLAQATENAHSSRPHFFDDDCDKLGCSVGEYKIDCQDPKCPNYK